MKKILVWCGVIGLIVTLLLVIFWKQALATYFMLYATYTLPSEIRSTNSTERVLIPSSSVSTFDTFNFDSITVPIPFEVATSSNGQFFYRVASQAGTFIFLFDDIETLDTFLTSSDDDALVCSFLSVRYGQDVCESNQTFFRAMVEADIESVSLFASPAEKLSQTTLTTLRSILLPHHVIESFSTDSIAGYITTTDDDNSRVNLFTENDNQYFIMTNVDAATLNYILENISSN